MISNSKKQDFCLLRFECYRQKIFNNVHLEMMLTEDQLIIQHLQKAEKRIVIELDLFLKIDWKAKGNKLQAMGLVTDKHHWYYADANYLFQLKCQLGAKVMYTGISDLYRPMQQIGQGTFSNVYLIKNSLDQQFYASKVIDKSTLDQGMGQIGLFQEIKSMGELLHPNIIRIYEVYEGEVSYYLILEYLTLELVDCLKHERLPMDDIKSILRQILEGVEEIHKQGYMHRDLKPENIMFYETFDNLKIIDFGLVAQTPSYSKCGTPGYVAPEILNLGIQSDCYDEKVDIFSIGVIFYKLLTNKDLFTGRDHDEILLNNQKCQIDLTIVNADKTIPKQAIDLLKLFLNYEPEKRPSCSDALKHEFLESQQQSLTQIQKQISPGRLLSPIQKKQSIQKKGGDAGSFFLDQDITEGVGVEAHIEPLPKVRPPSFYKVFSVDNMKEIPARDKCQTSNFKRQYEKKKSTYRAPNPKQLQEIYNQNIN